MMEVVCAALALKNLVVCLFLGFVSPCLLFLPPLTTWDKTPNRVVFDSSLKNVRDKLKKHQRTPTCFLYPSKAEFQRFKNHFPIWHFAKMAVIQHRLDLLKHYAKVSSAGWLKSAQCLHPTRLKKLFLCWSSSHFLSLWLDVTKSCKLLIFVNDDISHLEMILLPPPLSRTLSGNAADDSHSVCLSFFSHSQHENILQQYMTHTSSSALVSGLTLVAENGFIKTGRAQWSLHQDPFLCCSLTPKSCQ